jgi:hypothetical protein
LAVANEGDVLICLNDDSEEREKEDGRGMSK